MDKVGIAGAAPSVSPPHGNFLHGPAALRLCRAINDDAAQIRAQHPDRFGVYAILPLPDIAANMAELGRALDQLRLDGEALPTHAKAAPSAMLHLLAKA